MSTMKSFLTTLDLVMRDKVEPETVVEEDEIEETLTINEDGEIVDENWLTDKLKAAGTAVKGKFDSATKEKEADPTHWSNASKSKAEKGHMKLSRKMHKALMKDIDDEDGYEESPDSLMGSKDDDRPAIQEWNDFNKVYENIKQANELKVLSGQQLDEAFTKQHFELFADMLKNISDNDTRNDYADRLVAMFAKDNPRFDKETFLKAAGVWTADEKTELVYDEHGSVHQIRPSEVDAFLQGHPGRGLAESAEKKIIEDWGSSDWHVAMEEMWDSLLKRHNGKVTPETMEQAAEEVIMMHGEQMGYDEDSHDDGVSQVISMFLNRQDGIKNSDMVGLANDTWQHSEKTKYM